MLSNQVDMSFLIMNLVGGLHGRERRKDRLIVCARSIGLLRLKVRDKLVIGDLVTVLGKESVEGSLHSSLKLRTKHLASCSLAAPWASTSVQGATSTATVVIATTATATIVIAATTVATANTTAASAAAAAVTFATTPAAGTAPTAPAADHGLVARI